MLIDPLSRPQGRFASPPLVRWRVPCEGDDQRVSSPLRVARKSALARDDIVRLPSYRARHDHGHRSGRSHEALRAHRRRRRLVVPGRGGPRHGLRRTERRRQVDDDASRPRARRARLGRGTDRWQALRRTSSAALRGGRTARRRCDASRSPRARPSPLAREEQPPAVESSGRGSRARRPLRRWAQAYGWLLPRDGAAARYRCSHARRPARARVRRARQRTRSRRHPLDPRLPALARRRGAGRARVESPDERARGHRGRPRRDRPRSTDRQYDRRGTARVQVGRTRPPADTAGHRGDDRAGGGGRNGGVDRFGNADRHGTRARADRRPRGRERAPAARAVQAASLTRGRLHRPHARRGRVRG